MYKYYGLAIISDIESFGVSIVEAMKVGTVIVGLNKAYLTDLASNYSRTYIAYSDGKLADVLELGLLVKQASNYDYCKENSWGKVVNLIINEYKTYVIHM